MEPISTNFKSIFFVGFNWIEIVQFILLIAIVGFIIKFIYNKLKNKKWFMEELNESIIRFTYTYDS